jgi:hypothetical protein
LRVSESRTPESVNGSLRASRPALRFSFSR